MNSRRVAQTLLALSVAALGTAAWADTPEPAFWTWRSPLGDAAQNDHIMQLVFAWTPVNCGNPYGAADAVCSDASLLDEGEVAVMLQWFGQGDLDHSSGHEYAPALVYQVDDAVVDTVADYGHTPWFSNGILEAGHWMDVFIARYKTVQANPSLIGLDPNAVIPDPTRFVFDTEPDLSSNRLAQDYYSSTPTWELYCALVNDPADRWSEEDLPYWNQTLGELHAAFGSTPNFNYHCYESANQAWTTWWNGVWMAAFDAAMHEAAYSKIAAAWKGCKCSNYRTSVKIDASHYYLWSNWLGAHSWYQPHWEGSAHEQAPVLYPTYALIIEDGEDCMDATLRVTRHNVEACIESFGGSHAEELIPWIPNVGWSYRCGTMTKDGERRLLSMLRAKQVDKFVIYNSGAAQTAENWNDFNDLLDQVWGADADFVEITRGTCSQSDLADLVRYSDGDSLDITSAYSMTGDKTRFRADFDTNFDATPGGLRVHFEAKVTDAPEDATMTIKLRNFTASAWVTLDTFTVDDNGDLLVDYADLSSGASDYIESGTDQVKVMMIIETLGYWDDFTAEVDLVQLVGYDHEGLFEDEPKMWSTEPINSEPSYGLDIHDIHFRVRGKCGDNGGVYDGADTAQSITTRILGEDAAYEGTYGDAYGDGEAWVCLDYFGYGTDPNLFDVPNSTDEKWDSVPLILHPDDALDEPTKKDIYYDTEYWKTPWMSNGIAAARTFMEEFVEEYDRIQDGDPYDPNYPGEPNLPDPARFHFDNETYYYDHPNFGETNEVRVFAGMMEDGRWYTECIPGFFGPQDPNDPNSPPDPNDPLTMADLWAEFCAEHSVDPNDPNDYVQVFDVTEEYYDATNRDWNNWYKSLVRQALEAAMDEAAYSVIRAKWPNCKSSNYHTSSRYDGETTDGSDDYMGGRWWQGDFAPYTYIRYFWEAWAELQAPVLYPGKATAYSNVSTNASHPLYGQTKDDAEIAYYRWLLESGIESDGGGHEDEMCPWIYLPGGDYNGGHDKNMTRRLLTLLRAKKVDETIIYVGHFDYDPEDPNNWNDFADLLDQVYNTHLHKTKCITGTTSSAGWPILIGHLDGDALEVSGDYVDPNYVTIVDTQTTVNFDTTPDYLRVNFEAHVSDNTQAVTATFKLWNYDSESWTTVGSPFTLGDEPDLLLEYCELTSDVSDYISPINERVLMRMECTSSADFTVEIDWLLVTGSDGD